jgi:hypothetical protein
MICRVPGLIPQIPSFNNSDKIILYSVVDFATNFAIFVGDWEGGQDDVAFAEEGHVCYDFAGDLDVYERLELRT